MAKKNLVAKTLQIYAIIIAIAGAVVMMCIIANDGEWIVAIMVFASALVGSFFIYAFGEVIELLTAIKINTSGSSTDVEDLELPEI